MIALTEVQSSNLKAYGYEPSSKTFALRFGPGKVYHYADVTQDVVDKFVAAESKGKAVGELIRGKFRHTVVLDENHEDGPITTTSGATINTRAPWPLPASEA